MKKGYLRLIAAGAAVCAAATALMGMGEDPAERAVRELLTDRTAVISSVLKGDISYEAGREKLRHIEAEELYERDVDIMKKYRDSEWDEVRSMDILKTEKTSSLYDTAAFGVEIEWTCDGSEGEYRFKESYHVGAEKGGDGYRLISMNIK